MAFDRKAYQRQYEEHYKRKTIENLTSEVAVLKETIAHLEAMLLSQGSNFRKLKHEALALANEHFGSKPKAAEFNGRWQP